MTINTKTPHAFRSVIGWVPAADMCGVIIETDIGKSVITSPEGASWTLCTDGDYMFGEVMRALGTQLNGRWWNVEVDGPWYDFNYIDEIDLFVMTSAHGIALGIRTSSNGYEWTLRTIPEITP